jgi:hypothetical protein
VDRVTVEQMSRPFRYSRAEVESIRNRPIDERTPIPEVGDTVWCRLDEWEEPHEALVTAVQSDDDIDDQNLYEALQIVIGGRAVISQLDDPWPKVWLEVKVPRSDGFVRTVHTHCREARLRGSAGWLPLDWRTRRRPLPPQLEAMVTD